jgi:hypothetical protein
MIGGVYRTALVAVLMYGGVSATLEGRDDLLVYAMGVLILLCTGAALGVMGIETILKRRG